jgi:peptidoglycan hydrolase-like protein with peptidoglycan-binding domain
MKKTIAVIALLAVPALASAQAGLSRVAFLALQQELRDQGCGVTNVDGHYGPQTRRAIATCAKKFNTANNASALLAAMNIGFGPNDNPPAGGTGTGTGMATTTDTAAPAAVTTAADATPVSTTKTTKTHHKVAHATATKKG